ncbi:MAG: FliO/MopB family protein [Tepidisphaeraceae bacterium]
MNRRLRIARSLAGLILLSAVALPSAPALAAPASQPVSAYDNQPVRRSGHAPSTSTATPAESFNVERLITAMAVVLTLIFILRYAAGWLFPATKASRGSRAVRVLSRSTIAPRQQVMLLHVGRRVIIVGESGGALSSLGHIQDPDEVAELIGQTENTEFPTLGSRFGTLFGRARDELETPSPDLNPDDPESPTADALPPDELAGTRSEISSLIHRMRALTQTVRKE